MFGKQWCILVAITDREKYSNIIFLQVCYTAYPQKITELSALPISVKNCLFYRTQVYLGSDLWVRVSETDVVEVIQVIDSIQVIQVIQVLDSIQRR